MIDSIAGYDPQTRGRFEGSGSLEAWNEMLSLLCISSAGSAPFRASIRLSKLGAIIVGKVDGSAQRLQRDQALAAHSDIDHIVFYALKRGSATAIAAGLLHTSQPRQIGIADLGVPFDIELSEFECTLLVVPRALLGILPGDHCLHGQVLLAERPATAMLASQMALLAKLARTAGPTSHDELVSYTLGGLATLINPFKREVERPHLGSSDNSLLAQMARYIASNINAEDLAPIKLSAHFNVSRATVYRVFGPYGGVQQYIRDLRLDHAFEQIRRSAGRKQSVKSLARDLGFRSADAFSRAFERRFGMRPHKFQVGSRAAYEQARQSLRQNEDIGADTLGAWLRDLSLTTQSEAMS